MRLPSSLISSTRKGESIDAGVVSQIASSALEIIVRLFHACWRLRQWLMAMRYSQVRTDDSPRN